VLASNAPSFTQLADSGCGVAPKVLGQTLPQQLDCLADDYDLRRQTHQLPFIDRDLDERFQLAQEQPVLIGQLCHARRRIRR